MKTKVTIWLLTDLFLVVTLFASCTSKDKPCVHNTTEQNISAGDLSKVPYKDYTKLTFVRTSTNDTFTFSGQGWVTGYETVQNHLEDCYQNYLQQHKYIFFKSPFYAQQISLVFQYYSADGLPYIEINFNNTKYIVFPGNISSPYQYDSLTIQQKTYYNIRYFKNEGKPEYNTPYGCYYNKVQGILRMETSDKDKWELIKVE